METILVIIIVLLGTATAGLGFFLFKLKKELENTNEKFSDAKQKLSSNESSINRNKNLEEELETKLQEAEKKASTLLDEAEIKSKKIISEAEEKAKKILLETEEKSRNLLIETQKNVELQKKQLMELERTINQREEILEDKEKHLETLKEENGKTRETLEKLQIELKRKDHELSNKLTEISGLSKKEALEKLIADIKLENSDMIKKEIMEYRTKLELESDKIAMELIVTALNNAGTDYVAEHTTTFFQIPDKEMKGKIIGKEGRNIKSFEKLTGVQILLDDEDENHVVLSCFDPLRRELGRITLNRLVKDGRINPAKIEESIQRAREDLAKQIIKDGEEIAIKAGFSNYNVDHYKYLGRMKFRFSYGQNLAQHTLEVVNFAGKVAGELGLNVRLAKECALWHDIGKVESHEKEGDHMELGEQIGLKLGLNKFVLNAMYAHHMKKDPNSMESALIYIADANSSGRPGARNATTEDYVKRIKALEDIANSYEGVKQAYAIDAGREVRVFVDPVVTTDDKLIILADDIAKEIQTKERYPGNIKVTVIRENRAEAFAK